MLAATAALAVMTWRESRDPEPLSEAGDYPVAVTEFIPRMPAEERSFFSVSATAGICEEVLYLGILLTVLSTIVDA